MELLENISEYYDELFPISKDQKKFYEEESSIFNKPLKYLRIGCGTGVFESQLAKEGADVTGLETVPSLLESANRRRRTQLMSIRFFQMTTLEMAHFLGKGFYNIISILDNRLIFIHNDILLDKFFFDCKQLLSQNGKLIISVPNFEKYKSKFDSGFYLPSRESIRVKLTSKVVSKNSEHYLEQEIENGNGRVVPVTLDAQINLITKDKISELAQKNGFSKIDFYSDFQKSAFKSDSDYLFAVIS